MILTFGDWVSYVYGLVFLTFGGLVFLRLRVSDSYVWVLVFLRLKVNNCYVWVLDFLRVGVSNFYVLWVGFLTFRG